ncbi:hypothetical protein LINGRAHAP2_LOCUS9893, partial [Linum grandiflorum]
MVLLSLSFSNNGSDQVRCPHPSAAIFTLSKLWLQLLICRMTTHFNKNLQRNKQTNLNSGTQLDSHEGRRRTENT